MDMTKKEINEIAEQIKADSQREKAEQEQINKGFTITCNNCGQNMTATNQGRTGDISIDTHQGAGQSARLECKCGNLYKYEPWDYIPN